MITLVIGGTRSGKSEVAEHLAERSGAPVTYVATAKVTDRDFRARVDAHRARRPVDWTTIEASDDLAATIRAVEGTVIVDSLGTWIARRLDGDVDVEPLCDALVARTGVTVVVTEEVGLGVHAPTAAGLRFADALGHCNRRVASLADRVLLVVAGRVLALPLEPDDG